ncbi:uncharacterized protein LOC128021448 isoform X2 [Carassius gibelio]|uniref:uncharacterized protein LOC127969812 isoform X2 n=1 Tax=Carassius gibelio TaxID=101364 RepID=UPI002278C85D|nr:uncharacterized protein LOC127969812 isoform X2 [Carassius gibelio]XP_052464639.1 uncharacterized protein LOC128021448 isoform X2 [Carassius gibelio]
MAGPVSFRVLFGSEDDARKLTIKSGIPSSVDELSFEIKTFFGVTEQFRLQYKDVDFGNEFMNLLSISDIQDRSTLKVVYLPCEATTSTISSAPSTKDNCSTIPVTPSNISCSSSSQEPSDSASADSCSSNDTVILSSPDSRSCTWPKDFVVPRFSYCAEMQLQKGNDEFNASGTLLSLTPKLRSDILEGIAEEIIKYTAYPKDNQFEKVAEALIKTHPCLREKGTRTGCCGWKHYIKIKMMNFRTKLGRAGHPEVTVNSLKNKQKGQGKPAANIKKPRRAEVNFCPNHPRGETNDSLEVERVALLTEVKKKNNETIIKEKMQRTFSYRRQEILQEPMITEVRNRWPALFEVEENEDINTRRDCILRCLSVYLNEDIETLVKEYVDTESVEAESLIAQTTMGIYVIRAEGTGPEEEPSDVGVVLEGVEVLQNLPSVTLGCVMLFGLIYALNLNYPKDLKCTFEAFQKILMELDTTKLSPKVQGLKIKMLQ